MLVALLIIARTAHIGASILLTGIFTFELVVLGLVDQYRSDDFREGGALVPSGSMESRCGSALGFALVLARGREHE
jgi:hypothetical protein